jgi:uncharacterized protein
MFGLFRRLLPREERFFDLFARHSLCICAAAEELRAMLEGGEAVRRHYPGVLRHEDEADAVTREVVQAVRRTFVTPFDRSDIQGLIGRMDDSVDEMKKTAKAIALFEMREFSDDMRAMGDAIHRCSGILREVVPLLSAISRNATTINVLCEQIRQIEGEADDVHDAGTTALFRRSRDSGDAMRYIAENAVFDHLERVVDSFDDVANEIESIVVEHV